MRTSRSRFGALAPLGLCLVAAGCVIGPGRRGANPGAAGKASQMVEVESEPAPKAVVYSGALPPSSSSSAQSLKSPKAGSSAAAENKRQKAASNGRSIDTARLAQEVTSLVATAGAPPLPQPLAATVPPSVEAPKKGKVPVARIVSADWLAIRASPSLKAPIVGKLVRSSRVDVVITGRWARLSEGHWVPTKYLVVPGGHRQLTAKN